MRTCRLSFSHRLCENWNLKAPTLKDSHKLCENWSPLFLGDINLEVELALKTKGNPIGVAEYQLQPKLPADLRGKLHTAKQLVDAIKGELGRKNGDRD